MGENQPPVAPAIILKVIKCHLGERVQKEYIVYHCIMLAKTILTVEWIVEAVLF